jgi:hypothetical protein
MKARDRRRSFRLKKKQPSNAPLLKIFWRYLMVCGNL